MILLTTKKATAIYLRVSSLFFLCFISQSFATEDLVSFCFESKTNLTEAKESLSFLLLPKESVFLRREDNCFDVNTSPDRSKLLEIFLRKRYTLISEESEPKKSGNLQDQQCQLELNTTRNKEVRTQTLGVVQIKNVQELSTAKILLGLGRPGTLDLEGRSLYIECRKSASGVYQLSFSYSEEYKAKVVSEVSVRKGESIQVAQVITDLSQKSKVLGLPEFLYKEIEGQEKISYELKVN